MNWLFYVISFAGGFVCGIVFAVLALRDVVRRGVL